MEYRCVFSNEIASGATGKHAGARRPKQGAVYKTTQADHENTSSRYDAVIASCRPQPVTARRIQDVLETNGKSASQTATEDLSSLSLLSRLGGE